MAKEKKESTLVETESHESGLVSPEKNRILEEHIKEFPEGDPTVRRVNPSRDVVGRPTKSETSEKPFKKTG